jgi:hypothetical protein
MMQISIIISSVNLGINVGRIAIKYLDNRDARVVRDIAEASWTSARQSFAAAQEITAHLARPPSQGEDSTNLSSPAI